MTGDRVFSYRTACSLARDVDSLERCLGLFRHRRNQGVEGRIQELDRAHAEVTEFCGRDLAAAYEIRKAQRVVRGVFFQVHETPSRSLAAHLRTKFESGPPTQAESA